MKELSSTSASVYQNPSMTVPINNEKNENQIHFPFLQVSF